MTNPVSDIFTTLADDTKAALLGLVTQAHANIAANPTKETVVAQWALLALSAPTLLPSLQTDAITAVNNAVLAAATSALASAPQVVVSSTPVANA